MPLVDYSESGISGEMPVPWAKKDEVAGCPIAVIQAWGYLAEKFQVNLLCQLLEDRFTPSGEPVPAQFAISFDAESQDNPRRRWLAYFADPDAQPVGPIELYEQPASNQQGWVWSFRKVPLPAEAVPSLDLIQRSTFRQDWKRQALATYRARKARPVEPPPPPAPALNGAADHDDDIPF